MENGIQQEEPTIDQLEVVKEYGDGEEESEEWKVENTDWESSIKKKEENGWKQEKCTGEELETDVQTAKDGNGDGEKQEK